MNSVNISEIRNRWEAEKQLARLDILEFVQYTKDDYEVQWFHKVLAYYLQLFAEGVIKKLMVFMPPQHGKSELTSRRLPAYLLGIKPKLKIVGCSYSSDLSSSFNRDVQRIIDSKDYKDLFPDTQLNSKNVATDAKGSWLRNADIFEVVRHGGFYKSVGVGGSLTGTPADIAIIDDPVKDSVEADSLTYRTRVWEWYDKVLSTRLHNKSQVILTMTRWHEDDLAGRILKSPDAKNWVVLKLPAIKEATTHNEYDLRQIGEALWESRHSAEKIRTATERTFQALYQQNPLPTKGGLVFPDIVLVDEFPSECKKVAIGLDFGYSSDPTAAYQCGVIGNKLYVDQLIYETGLLNNYIPKRIPNKQLEVFCDVAPEIIDSLKIGGLTMARAVKKGAGSILAGIAILHDYQIHVTKRSFGVIQEQAKYQFKTDGYGNPTNDPQDNYNHAWDAIRYYAISKLSKTEQKVLAQI